MWTMWFQNNPHSCAAGGTVRQKISNFFPRSRKKLKTVTLSQWLFVWIACQDTKARNKFRPLSKANNKGNFGTKHRNHDAQVPKKIHHFQDWSLRERCRVENDRCILWHAVGHSCTCALFSCHFPSGNNLRLTYVVCVLHSVLLARLTVKCGT